MITWEIEIVPQVVEGKTAYINATRIDSDDSENPKTYTVSGWLGTQESQLALLDEIWVKHQAALAYDVKVKAFLEGLEAQAKTNLEARE